MKIVKIASLLLLICTLNVVFNIRSAKTQEVVFQVLWRAPMRDVYWESKGPWGAGPGNLGVDTGDVDGDGIDDIAAIPNDWEYGGGGTVNTLQVFKNDGTELWYASVLVDGGRVAIEDIDKDGKGEVFVFGTNEDTTASDAVIYAFDDDGTKMWEYWDRDDYGFWAVLPGWLIFTNLDDDPELEIIAANSGYPNSFTYALDTNGTLIWRFTGNEVEHLLFGDVNGDGVHEVVILTNVGHMVYVVDKITGSELWSFSTINYNKGVLGDITGDGINDIIVASGGAELYYGNKLYALRNDGTLWWSKDYEGGDQNRPTVPVLEDIDGDGITDIIVGAEQKVMAYKNDGSLLWTYGDPVFFDYRSPQLYRFDIDRTGHDDVIFFKGKNVYKLSKDGTAIFIGTLPLADLFGLKSLLEGGRVTERSSTKTAWLASGDINNDGFDELLFHEIIDGQFYLTVVTIRTITPPSPIITATIDVVPNALNLKSRGKWITAYIELPGNYSVRDINVSTIILNDTIPAELKPTAIGDYDNDTVPDLMVKFNRQQVIEYIMSNVDLERLYEERFMTITLTITGKLNDGTPFQGSDNIKIILPTPRQPYIVPI